MQINTPKDLENVKVRFFMGLTKRQTICFAVAGCVGFPLYLVLRKLLPTDAAMMLMMVAVFPIFLLAIYEKDGRTAEQVAKDLYRQYVASKGIRRYKSENRLKEIENKERMMEEVRRIEAKKGRKEEVKGHGSPKEKRHGRDFREKTKEGEES